MLNTTFTGTDGKEHLLVVSLPTGSEGNYHAIVDNYYKGAIIKYLDGWTWKVETDLLTSDDIGAVMDMVNKE